MLFGGVSFSKVGIKTAAKIDGLRSQYGKDVDPWFHSAETNEIWKKPVDFQRPKKTAKTKEQTLSSCFRRQGRWSEHVVVDERVDYNPRYDVILPRKRFAKIIGIRKVLKERSSSPSVGPGERSPLESPRILGPSFKHYSPRSGKWLESKMGEQLRPPLPEIPVKCLTNLKKQLPRKADSKISYFQPGKYFEKKDEKCFIPVFDLMIGRDNQIMKPPKPRAKSPIIDIENFANILLNYFFIFVKTTL